MTVRDQSTVEDTSCGWSSGSAKVTIFFGEIEGRTALGFKPVDEDGTTT